MGLLEPAGYLFLRLWRAKRARAAQARSLLLLVAPGRAIGCFSTSFQLIPYFIFLL